MRNLTFVVLAIVGLPATQSLATHPAANETITVFLNGQNEVGPDGQLGAGDPDGTAVATLENDHGILLAWNLDYQNISGETITGLHIHGPGATPTTNRDIFMSFQLPMEVPLPNGSIFGAISLADDPGLPTKLAAIFDNPSEFYLNLHTGGAGGFPGGAVRGQLAIPEPTTCGLVALAAIGLLKRRFRRVA